MSEIAPIANSGTANVSRRRMLQLVAASLAVVSGCAVFRSTSELDEAREDLRALLGELADGDAERVQLLAIGNRIDTRANELVGEHRAFIENFNGLAANRDVTADELTSIVADHEARRVWLRNDLLRLQDRMKAALPADEWERTLEILNRTGEAVAGQAKAGG
mgnify:CR=1 FL=1